MRSARTAQVTAPARPRRTPAPTAPASINSPSTPLASAPVMPSSSSSPGRTPSTAAARSAATAAAPLRTPFPARPVSLSGFTVLPECEGPVAATQAWAVLAVRALGCTDYALTRVFGRHCGTGTQVRLSAGRGFVLAPAGDEQHAVRLARRIREELGDGAWVSAAWRTSDDVMGGLREADDVLRIVSVLRRPPGVHRLDDVAVEYAVASNPEVSRRLVALIEPVLNRPELLRTLEVLIGADGNRARAAGELIIHRSTIDYRLGRIEALTGHSPVRVRGLQTLATALAAHALTRPRTTGGTGSTGTPGTGGTTSAVGGGNGTGEARTSPAQGLSGPSHRSRP